MTPTELLREMNRLLIIRGEEYDRNLFSDRYWQITDEYESVKAQYFAIRPREAKHGA